MDPEFRKMENGQPKKLKPTFIQTLIENVFLSYKELKQNLKSSTEITF